MTIGIDGTRGINEKAGIGRYTAHLCGEMARRQDIDTRFLFTAVRHKKEKVKEIKRLVGARRFALKSVPGEWKNTILGWPVSIPDMWVKNIDLWHAPSIWEAPLATNRKLVVTIHDMTPFLFPELRGQKVSKNQQRRTIKTTKKADSIICISKATADDLVKFIPEVKDKISIVPLGVEDSFKQLNYTKKEKVILTVGTVEPRKNLKLLFETFERLPEKLQKDYKIWVIGASGWRNSDIFDKANKLGDKVKFFGYVSDDELVELYNRAEIFAFPSIYEGFGLPLLEAMACGLPIIANNISSIPEVTGDAAMLMENEVTRWKAGLERLMTDTNLRAKMRHAGLLRAKKFTWQKMAEETVKVYEKTHNS